MLGITGIKSLQESLLLFHQSPPPPALWCVVWCCVTSSNVDEPRMLPCCGQLCCPLWLVRVVCPFHTTAVINSAKSVSFCDDRRTKNSLRLGSHISVQSVRESSIDNADAQAAQGCQQNPNNPWLASCVQSCSSVTDHKTLRITERIARQLRPSSEPGPRHPPRQAVTEQTLLPRISPCLTTHNAEP